MEQDNKKIIELIQKHICNRSTDSERHELINWIKSANNHDSVTKSPQEVWQMIDTKEANPITENERLVLHNEAFQLLNKNNKQQNTIQKNSYTTLFRFVAVLVIIFSATLSIYVSQKKDLQTVLYTQQETKQGEQKKIQLIDGTKITLNATSRIIIPSNFNNDSRLITLEGEAFFDVAPNTEKPFIIKSGDAQIKVLGTSFNVKAYDTDELIAVTVSTGKVNVGFKNENMQLNLVPNEHLVVNKITGGFEKKILTENNYAKWQNGTLFFEKETLQAVVKELNRKYNQQIILQTGLEKYIISGMHDNKSLEAVVKAICYTTKLKFKNSNENILIYKDTKH